MNSFCKIRIKGQSAITGGDNPLIGINGVPINSGNFNGSTVGVNGGGVYADRDAYIAEHPLVPGRELEQINTQYWIASFLNGPEAIANFRRTGYPALTPNPYGQPNNPDVPNGTFIRRIGYATSELSVNATNVNAAIAIMGPDK